MIKALAGVGLLLLVTRPVAAALPGGIEDAALRQAAVASFPEYLDLLALPNESSRTADMAANADWLVKAFEKRGFRASQFENHGKPVVFADYPSHSAKAKTVLFYMHFDGQPVIPGQWMQANPWGPVVKRRGPDGAFAEVDRALLLDPKFDPELRVFARSASDDKAPIMMLLASLDLLKQTAISPAVHLKVILDSEEEVNSPGIGAVIAAHKPELAADALVIIDGPTHPSGLPTVVFGNRGLSTFRLTVFGARSPLHSGHYGNYSPNPAQRLAVLLASMKGDDGRVTIPGYYDRTKLSDADLASLREVGDDEVALRKRLGIAEADHVAGSYQEDLQYPSLNVRGLASGAVGEKVTGVVPSTATAEIDIRTTTEADAAYLLPLVRHHIEAQGYHILDHDPTDEERALYPKLIRFTLTQPLQLAARQEMESPIGQWATSALASAFQVGAKPVTPVRLRLMGATLPTHEIVAPLQQPFVLVPVVNGDNNQHSYDENLRMGNYLTGMRSIIGLITTPFAPR